LYDRSSRHLVVACGRAEGVSTTRNPYLRKGKKLVVRIKQNLTER